MTGRRGNELLPKPAGKTRAWYPKGPPSVIAQKVYHALLKNAHRQWDGNLGRPYAMSLPDISGFLNEGRGSRVGYARIREVLEEIADTPLRYEFFVDVSKGRQKWEGTTVLMTFAASEDAGKVVYHLPPEIERFLMDPEYYCYVDDGVVRNASSKYTLPSYEILAPLVASRDAAKADYDPTEFAKLIGYPVPEVGNVEAWRLHQNVLTGVVKDINSHSSEISVQTSRSDARVGILVRKRAAVQADSLGLTRPEESRPGKAKVKRTIPRRPGKAVLELWERHYPGTDAMPWWDDFRARCGDDPHYATGTAWKFMERVRVLMDERERQTVNAMREDWQHVPDSFVQRGLRKYNLPPWAGLGIRPSSRGERMLKFWHAYARWHFRAAKMAPEEPHFRMVVEEIKSNSGRAFLMALATEELNGWPFLTAYEAGKLAFLQEDGNGE